MSSDAKRLQVMTRVGSIALHDAGAGPAVVFWPSLFSDHRLFSLVQRELGPAYRVIRIDGPGFGLSDAPQGEVQADVYADVVLELTAALGIDQFVMAGCSWGGQISAHVGVKAPKQVQGVLIMNSPLGPSRGGHAFELVGTRLFGSQKFWGEGVARSMFSMATRKAFPERVQAFVASFRSFDPKAAARTARTVLTRFPGLHDVLPQLTVPTTVLMGAEDRLYPVDQMLPMAKLVPSGKISIIPSCGHLAPLESPEAVASELRDLIQPSTTQRDEQRAGKAQVS